MTFGGEVYIACRGFLNSDLNLLRFHPRILGPVYGNRQHLSGPVLSVQGRSAPFEGFFRAWSGLGCRQLSVTEMCFLRSLQYSQCRRNGLHTVYVCMYE